MNSRRTAAAVVGSGVAWGLCFRAQPDGVLPFLALVPLLGLAIGAARAGRRAWRFGWLQGFVAWLVAIPWIEPTLRVYGQLPVFVSAPLLVLLAAYLGAYHALFVAGCRWFGARLPAGVVALVLAPAWWVVLELVRSWLFTGFPWNLAGYAAVAVPGALASTALVGTSGLSFAVVAANGALALAWQRRAPHPLLVPVGLVLAGLLAEGVAQRERGRGTTGTLPVAVLQPNIPNQVGYDAELALANVQLVLDQAAARCRRPGTLVVLAESALWPYTWDDYPWLQRSLRAAAAPGCALLFNTSAAQSADVYFNSALLIGEAGPLGRYDKNHLVPYGEYVPLGDLLPFVSQLARNAGEFTPGEGLALLPWAHQQLGVAICFEVIFAHEVARRVRRGATVLVTMTNDAWYGDTAAPWQHLRAARFRAAETRRPLLRAAITGISAVIDPWGRVERSLLVGERGAIEATVAGRTALTPFVRAPWAAEAACAALLAVAIGFAVAGRRTAPPGGKEPAQ